MADIIATMWNSVSAQIGTAQVSETWTYAPLAAGFDNVAEALNEVVQQYWFMDGAGFATNNVTGMAPAFTLTGRRIQGDAAQDFIFGAKYKLLKNRKSSFEVTVVDNSQATPTTTTYVVGCTICNVQEWSGATTDDSAISVEIRFDGAPTATTA